MRERFVSALEKVGGQVLEVKDAAQAVAYIAQQVRGSVLLPVQPSLERMGLMSLLESAGVGVCKDVDRISAPGAEAGITGVNFALADTGTLVIDSTAEPLRLATTLPGKHFALLDPRKIIADSLQAVSFLREFHQRSASNYLAYITGPSRTADIERVLTIGVHGPRELHVLLLAGLSDGYYEL